MGPGVLVHDGRLARSPGHLPDQHRAWRRDRLNPGGCVHHVTGDHALTRSADRHRRLACQYAGPCPQALRAHLPPECVDSGGQFERRSHGTFGVVFLSDRGPPDSHDGITYELLDRAPVEFDQSSGGIEVAREQFADLLRVPLLRNGSETDEVHEQDRYHPALSDRPRLNLGGWPDRGHACRRRNGRTGDERRAANPAKPGACERLGPAVRTSRCQ